MGSFSSASQILLLTEESLAHYLTFPLSCSVIPIRNKVEIFFSFFM